ncbi:MAG: PEP/pyruvate-binding domain-containing protein [Bacteroidetes bacterium]|nr:PEP/pyruvate-binding domain-containing protein [Bacteroidota bacterium]
MNNFENELLPFNRSKFLNAEHKLTYIGSGAIGGKAHGLAGINHIILNDLNEGAFPGIEVGIPAMTIIRTDVFDAFIKRNKLADIAYSDEPDDRIAHAFQKADLPFEILGDLRALISQVTSPLAVRSSSMLEDAMHEPFAGIYGTKMTPNNQPDINARFNKLVEAIKYVYATTFFKSAKDYMSATPHKTEDEKMAIIIQEVIGKKYKNRFYPELSGVGRSHNYYAFGHADPKDGIVNLALGLGKTIVDGGNSWSYTPAYPKADPPFNSINDMLNNTQRTFWSVNMGKTSAYDPVKETEYMLEENIVTAEEDDTLRYVASTLDSQSGRIVMGVSKSGPRLLNFSPILRLGEIPLNNLLIKLMDVCEKNEGAPVEIEFAMTFSDKGPHKFGFLQVRPMAVSNDVVELKDEDLAGDHVLASSEKVLGNGTNGLIQDIVYIKQEEFDVLKTYQIAEDLEKINKTLVNENKPYLLIGFGRWGTSDVSAGIPVNWGQISGAKAIIEAALAHVNFDLSQGSHFFHNVTGFGVYYFSIPFEKTKTIEWSWLNAMPASNETRMVRHIHLKEPIQIKVDGRTGKGTIIKP